jgi:hypothetical protein
MSERKKLLIGFRCNIKCGAYIERDECQQFEERKQVIELFTEKKGKKC